MRTRPFAALMIFKRTMLAAAGMLVIGTSQAEGLPDCTAGNIQLRAVGLSEFDTKIPEGGTLGTHRFRFSLLGSPCKSPPTLVDKMGVPQDIDLPFCFEIYETTRCDSGGVQCTSGRVGHNVRSRMDGASRYGGEICGVINTKSGAIEANIWVAAENNNILERARPDRIIATMHNPFRYASFEVIENDD